MNSGRGEQTPVEPHEEPRFVVRLGDRKEAGEQPHQRVPVRLDFLIALHRHTHTGNHQKGAEDVKNPVEVMDQRDAHGDHGGTHDQGAQDAPEQHLVLVQAGYAKVGEDKQKNEQVVDAEGLFEQVAGEKHQRYFRPFVDVQADVEHHGQRYPQGAPQQRLADPDDVLATVKHTQIQGQHDQNENVERHPNPNRYVQ